MNVLGKKFIAEMIGTFVLVFVACGVCLFSTDVLAIAFTFGLAIVACAYTIGDISGCHINPAVSLMFLIKKKLTTKEFFVYVLAQLLGAFIASLLLYWISTLNPNYISLGENLVYGNEGFESVLISIIVEVILTVIFLFVIISVTSKKENSKIAGLVIGLTLAFVHLLGIYLTGTSVNPARSFAPAVVNWIFYNDTAAVKDLYVFFVGPLLGSVVTVLLYNFLYKEQKEGK